MTKNDFTYNEKFGNFEITVNGIAVSINGSQMSDELAALTQRILDAYPGKIEEIAEYLSNDDGIVTFYGGISADEIAEKLHEPSIRVDKTGGMLSFCKHELDDEHIIDLEFGGALEAFYEVSIDG